MTPLRFRAWHLAEQKMRDVFLLDFRVGSDFAMVNYYCPEVMDARWGNTKDQVVVMQSTGLRDRGGREIFEGDIIEMEWSESDKGRYPVEWRDGGFEFFPEARFNPDGDELAIATVIGNVYENPDLLP
jgi:hypothetical protein